MSAVMDNSVPLPPSVADSVTTGTPSPMKQNKNALMDALFKNLTRLFAFLVFILLAAILVSLIYGSRESLAKYGLSFLWLNDWDPVRQNYGAVVPIIGTLLTSAIALIIAVPVSFGIAIFLTELSPTWLRRPLGTAVEMLAAIPSIIYGMWGLFVFVPVFQQYVQPFLIATLGSVPIIGGMFAGPPFGIGIFTAGLILSIMIIPVSYTHLDVYKRQAHVSAEDDQRAADAGPGLEDPSGPDRRAPGRRGRTRRPRPRADPRLGHRAQAAPDGRGRRRNPGGDVG